MRAYITRVQLIYNPICFVHAGVTLIDLLIKINHYAMSWLFYCD